MDCRLWPWLWFQALLCDRHQPSATKLHATQTLITRPLPPLPYPSVYNPKWRASHPLEDCVTNTWVGHGRWLLLDLTAQKADYGPALGGEGVVQAG